MSDSGWQVLDFSDFKGSLTYKRGNVHVRKHEDGSEVDVPLAHAAVVIVGVAATVSGALLSKLSEYDVALLVCDWRKVPIAGAMPMAGAYSDWGEAAGTSSDKFAPAKKCVGTNCSS